MKKILLGIFAFAALYSCNKKSETETVNQTDSSGIFKDEENVTDSTLVTSTKCYFEAKGKDTVFAQIDDNLGTVTGKMYYKNFEKDSSSGDIIGSSTGDTIKVDYTFQSEGTTSSREIWLLKKDGKLYEGIGELDKTGTTYANPKAVKFDGGHVLNAAECKIVEKALAKTVQNVTPTAKFDPMEDNPKEAAEKEKSEPASAVKPVESKKLKVAVKPAEVEKTVKTTETKKTEPAKTETKKK